MNSEQLVGHGPGSAAAALAGDWGRGDSAGCGLLVWLVVLPLGAAVLPRWLGRQPAAAQRGALVTLLGTAAVAAYLLMTRLGDGATDELVQPLWQVLAVQRLQLSVGLGLDRPAAVLLLVAAAACAWAVRRAERGQVAGLAAAYAATAVALLGDSLVTRLIGWELLTVAGWALGGPQAQSALSDHGRHLPQPFSRWRERARVRAVASAPRPHPASPASGTGVELHWGHGPLWVARLGDATLLVATVLLFWALGGSWSSSRLDARYQLDASPPQSAGAADAGSVGSVTAAGPTLDLPSLRFELHRPAAAEPGVPTLRATLHNKLWLGGRLLTWLGVLFGLAAALKAVAGALQLLTNRESALAVRVWLGVAPALGAGHLLWRLW